MAANEGTPLTNATAGPMAPSYEICQVSGFKAERGELVERWDGLFVLPRFNEPRNEQDFIRPQAEKLEGSIRPEPGNVFITTRVLPEDL